LADNTPVIHIVGAESLLGREVVDVLGSAKLPAHVKVVAAIEPDESATAILTAQKGEAVILSPLRPGELAGSRVVLLADTAASPTKILEAAQAEPNPPILIDLTGALEEIWELVRRLNRHVEESKPWELAKDEAHGAALDRVLYDLADGLRAVAIALAAYLPETAPQILAALRQPDDLAWENAQPGRTAPTEGIEAAAPLFPRVDLPAAAA